MKASTLIQLYTQGQRNFQKENLRGQKLRGANLSNADFREADIRGTDFTNANLSGANFHKAQAGLSLQAVISVILQVLFLSLIAGFTSAIAGLLLGLVHDSTGGGPILGLLILTVPIITFIFIGQGKFGRIASYLGPIILIGAFACTGAISGLIADKGASYFSYINMITSGILLVSMFSFALANAVAIVAISNILVKIFVLFLEFVFLLIGTLWLIFAPFFIPLGLIFPLASSAVIWCILPLEYQNFRITSMAVDFLSINATCFRGANLEGANFSQAKLSGTDIRYANLSGVNWQDAENLDWMVCENTYLKNPANRQLVVSGEIL
ncbi:MAG: pentapeptide repeat-containing protein [Leptolyngbyaceae bacterium]|nr:pentapeptide repeat-containing protein [Leptolyngbyaceae bacterium]